MWTREEDVDVLMSSGEVFGTTLLIVVILRGLNVEPEVSDL
jgi:hypothetical protein